MDQPTEDEAAAALAAIQAYLAVSEAPTAEEPAPSGGSGWRHAAKLTVQHLRPIRLATAPRWNTIERLRRAVGGSYGITGL